MTRKRTESIYRQAKRNGHPACLVLFPKREYDVVKKQADSAGLSVGAWVKVAAYATALCGLNVEDRTWNGES